MLTRLCETLPSDKKYGLIIFEIYIRYQLENRNTVLPFKDAFMLDALETQIQNIFHKEYYRYPRKKIFLVPVIKYLQFSKK